MADSGVSSAQEDAPMFDHDSQLDGSVDKTLEVEMEMAIDVDPNLKDAVVEQPPEPRVPTQKDISLREFLSKMDDYAPIVYFPANNFCCSAVLLETQKTDFRDQIPDAVTEHYLTLAGLPPASTPLHLSRLLALATQKFIADIAADAYQYSRMRSSGSGAGPAAAAASGAAIGLQGVSQQQQQPQQREDKGKSGAHILGVQRPGYGGGGGGAGQGGAVLTMEDLGCAVGEYGVNVKRGEFYR